MRLQCPQPAVFIVILLALAMLVFTLHPMLATLRYRPAGGPLWLALSGQLIHLGPRHLILNLGGLIIAVLCACNIRQLDACLGALACAALCVAIGLRFDQPPLNWYVGISGALYGAVAWLALAYYRQAQPHWLQGCALLFCLGVGVKAVAGLFSVAGPGHWLGIPPAPSAHLYGYIGGLIWAAGQWTYRRVRRTA